MFNENANRGFLESSLSYELIITGIKIMGTKIDTITNIPLNLDCRGDSESQIFL